MERETWVSLGRSSLLLGVTRLFLDIAAELLGRVSGDGTDDGIYHDEHA
jgi:hypothetical protein